MTCTITIDPQAPPEQVWKPPLTNHLRLDVDMGFDVHMHRFSIGVVVRDSQGIVRGASACIIRYPRLGGRNKVKCY